ncbi:UNVERIFIED_CONTAM: hypothetical protein HDU68_001378 [Siphonaria sp. JEL0065]|nr:hypothetical protein HDU68_001378 [Siphonaria sp. JEL0065]
MVAKAPKAPPHLVLQAPNTASAFVSLLAAFLLASLMATHLAFHLPTPKAADFVSLGFSEGSALVHVKALAEDIGPRVVGTRNEKRAEAYVLDTLAKIKAESRASFTIDVQRSSGSHAFSIMKTDVMKNYINITNIVAHISCGPKCDKNAVLVNAHYDSQVGTPGACDDATPIAVMLELARIFSKMDPSTFRNSLVLLFNGAEETLQDASHAFSTSHPLAKTIRSFINLEAMGNSGKEVLFQANSKGLVEAYGKSVRRPHGTVASNDLFKTGLIMSDTDYRQFLDYGGMLGIDMAIYQNSYLYHTMLDTAENIEPGLIQHMGENTLDLSLYLMTTAEIEKFEEGREFIYFDLFDTLFFVYDTTTATVLHSVLILVGIIELIRPGLFPSYSRASAANPTQNPTHSFLSYFKTCIFIGANFAAALLTPVLAGIVTQYVLGKPLMYFRQEWHAFLIFCPASLLGIFAIHIFARLFIHTDPLDTPVAFERRAYAGNVVVSIVLIVVMTQGGLGSTYIPMFQLSSLLIGLFVDRFISPGGNGVLGSHFPINPLSYFLAAFLPIFIITNIAWSFTMLFVPLTGRLGPDTPADAIVGGLVGLLMATGVSGILSTLLARCSHKWLLRGSLWSLVTFVVVLSILLPRHQFDELHPKRLFVQYSQNATSGEESVVLAHADPVSINNLVSSLSRSLGNVTYSKISASENDHQATVFFPFSHYIEAHKFEFGSLGLSEEVEGVKKDPIPIVEVQELEYDSVAKARKIIVKCYHPHHIIAKQTGTTLKFDAQVIAWSLAGVPDPSFTTHVISNHGGYPANFWNVTLKFKTASPSTSLPLHFSAVETNTYDALEPYTKARKPTGDPKKRKALHQWLWANKFRSGQVLRRVQNAIEGYGKTVGLGNEEWSTEGYMAVDQVTIVV